MVAPGGWIRWAASSSAKRQNGWRGRAGQRAHNPVVLWTSDALDLLSGMWATDSRELDFLLVGKYIHLVGALGSLQKRVM